MKYVIKYTVTDNKPAVMLVEANSLKEAVAMSTRYCGNLTTGVEVFEVTQDITK